MTNTYKNIALVGASGSIGSIILKSLVASSSFNITVLCRADSNAIFPASVTVRKTDYSEADLKDAFSGQDVVISALGAHGFEQQQKLVDAAFNAKVKRFIPSEFSADSQNKAVQDLLPLFLVKSNLLEYLKSKESADFSWTSIVTSGLFDWAIANGFLEFDIKERTATIWDGGNKKFTLVNEDDMGKSVVAALQHPEETRNRHMYVASVETTQKEILSALEAETGASWTIKNTTTEEQLSEAATRLQGGDFTGAFILVRATVFGNTKGLNSNYREDETLANETLGVKMEDIKFGIKRAVSA